MVPEGWKRATLGDVARIASGATPSRARADYWESGTIPWVSSGKVNDILITEPSALITERALAECSLEMLPIGAILVGIIGQGKTRGTVARLDIAACANQNVAYILPKADVHGDFVFSYLRHQYARLRSSGHGSNQDALNCQILKQYPLPLPPLPEQRAIAAVLATWDRAIKQATRLVEAKRRLKQGLMQQLLTGKRLGTTTWHKVRLGDVATETFRPVAWNDDAVYRLASVRRWSGGLFARESLSGHQIKVKKLHTIREGDFLISHIQSAYGAMALVPAEFDGAQVSELYTILVPVDRAMLDMRFLAYLSELPDLRRQAYLSSNGFFAERLRLNFDPREFLKQTVLLPRDLRVQSRMADMLDTLTCEIDLQEQRASALKRQKQTLAQKLLTGEVRVKLEVEA